MVAIIHALMDYLGPEDPSTQHPQVKPKLSNLKHITNN